MNPMFNPELQFGEALININNQINYLNQEIRRINRRLSNLEKNLIPLPYDKLTPTPLNETSYESMNNSYTKDNYII